MLRPSSVRSRIGTRISSRNRCGPVISTPARASSSAGSNSVAHGEPPVVTVRLGEARRRAPARRPTTRRRGTPASTRRRSRSRTSSIGPCGREGTAKKQSSSVGSAPASRRRRKPPPAGPVSGPSATNAASGGGHDGVDGVASAREGPGTGLGGVTVPGCDGSAHAESVEAPDRIPAARSAVRSRDGPDRGRQSLEPRGDMFGFCTDLRHRPLRRRLSPHEPLSSSPVARPRAPASLASLREPRSRDCLSSNGGCVPRTRVRLRCRIT